MATFQLSSAVRILGLFAVVAVSSAQAQSVETRFQVTSVGDSTVSFPIGKHKWVVPGRTGIVVDPKRQDVLVARISVLSVADGNAQALITGQTTTVQSGYVAVMEPPAVKFYSGRSFWLGTALGAVLGFVIGNS
jgi:hypothetical protein